MSNQHERSAEPDDQPLFQNQEEQERIYSPQEAGADMPAVERDRDDSAAQGPAVSHADREQDDRSTQVCRP